MRRMLALSLVATVLLASCEKEIVSSEDVKIPGTETSVLRIGIPDTKTSLGELDGSKRKVYWSDGDKISVNGIESEALSGIAEKSTEAEFALTAPASAPYSIVYPSDIWVANGLVNLPATQTYVAGNVADGAVPMAGYSASGLTATLGYLCAVVKVSIAKDDGAYPDTDDISTVAFAGNADEQLSGHFVVDYENGTLAEISSVASGSVTTKAVTMVALEIGKTVTVSPASPIPAESSLDVYLVVPARTYESGFSVTITDVEGHSMVKSTTSSATLQAGHIYNLTPVKFKPTGTAAVINIGSAEELVTFASAYNAGEFSGRELTVNLTDNISFSSTTSAAFSATGGIGTNDGSEDPNYFHGTFNGGNHTISNYTGSVPLFAYTLSGAVIKDLILDESCNIAFEHAGASAAYFGPVVGYHRGSIDNVKVKGSLSIADAEVEKDAYIGGIAGRVVVGSITNSSFEGSLAVGSGFSGATIGIGGIAGVVTNATGTISDCVFAGTVDNQGHSSGGSKNSPDLMIGGIVGSNAGTVSSCTTVKHETGVTVTLNDGSDHDYNGTIVTHSTLAYCYAMGGVAGINDGTVEACVNNAPIVNIFHGPRDSGDETDSYGRWLHVGGIVGVNKSNGSVLSGDNKGAIIDRATPKIHYVGGVVGLNHGVVASSDNESTAAIGIGTAHISPYGPRILYAGGVIGSNSSTGSVSNIHNDAGITMSRVETGDKIMCNIGGVIGRSDASVDGSAEGGTIVNTGAVSQSSKVKKCLAPTEDQDYGYFLGGVVGYATQAVKNVSNSGNVAYACGNMGTNTSGKTDGGAQYVYLGGVVGKVMAESPVDIATCVNSAKVTFSTSSAHFADTSPKDKPDTDKYWSAGVLYSYIYLGGVAGYAANASIKGNCTNSGVIKGGDGSGNRNTANTFWVGGIVGYLTGSSSISNCTLAGTGQAYNDHWSNKAYNTYNAPMAGGIAGQVVGEAGSVISITNCSIAETASVNGRRGDVGGIVGAAQYANITSCTVPIAFSTSQSAYGYGGIAALAKNTTISSCTFSGASIQSSQIVTGGGIVGVLDADSTISGCNSYVGEIKKGSTVLAKSGGIAGESVAGSTIQNSHCKVGMAICSDSNFSGSGNAADLTD